MSDSSYKWRTVCGFIGAVAFGKFIDLARYGCDDLSSRHKKDIVKVEESTREAEEDDAKPLELSSNEVFTFAEWNSFLKHVGSLLPGVAVNPATG